jgi:hypothetical protein
MARKRRVRWSRLADRDLEQDHAYAGGSAEGTTDAGGFVTFDYDRSGPLTLFLDGERRGTYDYAETQSVTIML